MASVDGLVSGMDTTTVINQLMQAEAAPQTALRSKASAANTTITAYQSVNAKVATVQTLAAELAKTTTWQTTKATSSSTSVAATAAVGTASGQLTFDVRSLAKAQVTTAVVDATAPLTTNGTLTLTGAGLTDPLDITVDPDSDTPDGVAAAINAAAEAAGANVRATVVTTDLGQTIQLGATKTGLANSFSITGLVAPTKVAIAASDAVIRVGDPTDPVNDGGYTISSSTNTFTTALTGVSLTVSKVEDDVTLSVGTDSGSLADKMQAMVDATNSALDLITKQTSYDATTKVGGPLTADYSVREMQMNLLSAVSNGGPDSGSFSTFGLSLDKSGKLTFDRDKFLSAYAADPSGVSTAAGAAATAMQAVADGGSNAVTGKLTIAIQNTTARVTDLNKEADDWNVRLDDRKAALQKQFSNLEVALGKMKSQSSWLAGSLAGLPHGG